MSDQNIFANALATEDFRDPEEVLHRFSKIEHLFISKDLRGDNRHKSFLEMRVAALFCKGMSKDLNRKIDFTLYEDSDFDFVARDSEAYYPVQIKDVVPRRINEEQTIQKVLSSIENKYQETPELSFCINISRLIKGLNLDNISIRNKFGGVYILFSTSADVRFWSIYGDIQEDPNKRFIEEFSYLG